MYTIYVKFNCFPGKREEFVEAVKAAGVLDAIRAEDGCLGYDYYYSDSDPCELLLIEAWETKGHQEVHIGQPHMATLRSLKEGRVVSGKLGEFELK